MTVSVTPSTSVEKDSLTTTPSTDSKSPVNTDSWKKWKKVHNKSAPDVDKDNENNEKIPEKQSKTLLNLRIIQILPWQLSCLKRMMLFI